jgi:hypothetical protein
MKEEEEEEALVNLPPPKRGWDDHQPSLKTGRLSHPRKLLYYNFTSFVNLQMYKLCNFYCAVVVTDDRRIVSWFASGPTSAHKFM